MRAIIPINNNGSIQLKFTVSGKRYSLNPIPGGTYGEPRAMDTARAIATRIHNDRLAGHFDPSLTRYRLEPKAAPKPTLTSLLDLWDLWVDTLDLPAATKAGHYEAVRRMIAKAAPDLKDTGWLTRSPLAPATINKRLSSLRSCLNWAIKSGKACENPWLTVKSRKADRKPIRPFGPGEIREICAGFDSLAPSYAPFVRFLFLTGCRLSEAIGIRWSDIDLTAKSLTISSSLPIDRTGNGSQRVRKATKTGSIRTLGITPTLEKLLRSQKATQGDLVFHSPKGYPVSAQNLRRAWVKVLKAHGVPYRRLHVIRHTVLSMAVEQGTPLTGVAYLAGHKNTRMVIETYGHMINRPKLPDVPIGARYSPLRMGCKAR